MYIYVNFSLNSF